MKTTVLMMTAAVSLSACGAFTEDCIPSVPYPQPGSCPIPGAGKGKEGGPCDLDLDWEPTCEAGSTCVNETCLPCGKSATVCCKGELAEGDGCDGTLACDPASDEGYDLCNKDCGELGEPCCNEGVCIEGTCNTDTDECEIGVTPPPGGCGGGNAYLVWFVEDSSQCIVGGITVNSSSAQAAIDCVQAELPIGITAGHVGETPQWFDVCLDGEFSDHSLSYENFSQAGAEQCVFSDFSSDDYTLVSCPAP